MDSPWVSIVVVNYNYARFLPRSIGSALAQTHPRTEVIVVDDASVDDSREVIQGYADRVKPVLQPRNAGQGAAFNAGFAASRGEVVLFLDADDWLYPEAAARVLAACEPGVAKVHFRLDLVDAEGRVIDLFPAPEVAFDDGDVVPRLLSTGRYETSVTSGNAFARAALSAVLPVPEEDYRISADGYLVTLAPFHGRVASIEDPLGAYVLHGANNWVAVAGKGLGARFRRSVEHDFTRYEALRREAAGRGLAVAPDLGLRDPLHLTYRLGSLALDPPNHPVAGDSRAALGLRGAWASRSARLPAGRRALLTAWFLAMGVLPRPLAATLFTWRMLPETRPSGLGRVLRRVRAALR
jgi:glycosyltransferase involved in cell wall biosynthesis